MHSYTLTILYLAILAFGFFLGFSISSFELGLGQSTSIVIGLCSSAGLYYACYKFFTKFADVTVGWIFGLPIFAYSSLALIRRAWAENSIETSGTLEVIAAILIAVLLSIVAGFLAGLFGFCMAKSAKSMAEAHR